MKITDDPLDMATVSVADVALAFPQALDVFNRYDLDYCCGGKRPFVEVCERAGLNAEAPWLLNQAKSGACGRLISFNC